MSNELSELHIINIPRADKGRWVAASRAVGSDLATWAMTALNEAAKDALKDAVRPAWTRSLTGRTADCLVKYGLTGKREVRAVFADSDFNWQSIPNFGPKCNDEVLKWLSK